MGDIIDNLFFKTLQKTFYCGGHRCTKYIKVPLDHDMLEAHEYLDTQVKNEERFTSV